MSAVPLTSLYVTSTAFIPRNVTEVKKVYLDT